MRIFFLFISLIILSCNKDKLEISGLKIINRSDQTVDTLGFYMYNDRRKLDYYLYIRPDDTVRVYNYTGGFPDYYLVTKDTTIQRGYILLRTREQIDPTNPANLSKGNYLLIIDSILTCQTPLYLIDEY